MDHNYKFSQLPLNHKLEDCLVTKTSKLKLIFPSTTFRKKHYAT
jgi:hypothetical protein